MPRSSNAALRVETLALIVAGAFVSAIPERALFAQTLVGAASELAPQSAVQSSQQLQQLVAPIALYPDALVAQILAASTYPTQVVEADRWMQEQSTLTGDQLANAVNAQSWDPSVSALTQFPSVLANMDKNIFWTSSLGDAFFNQPQDVMSAVQVMRARAERAGELQSDSRQLVTMQGTTIIIQPANPAIVYVPAYDPWTIYGTPLAVYSSWVPVPGIFYAGRGISWGLGFGIGQYGGFSWGWHNWGADWRAHDVLFNRARYVSRSPTFINRRPVINRPPPVIGRAPVGGGRVTRGPVGGNRGGQGAVGGFQGPVRPSGFEGYVGGGQGYRGYVGGSNGFHGYVGGQPNGTAGARSSAFSGFGHGGTTSGISSRGRASTGGGAFGGGARGGGTPQRGGRPRGGGH